MPSLVAPKYNLQPQYKHFEIQTLDGQYAFYFDYNPLDLKYQQVMDSTTDKFIDSDREITEILRSQGLIIQGAGKFVTFPAFRTDKYIGSQSPATAAGQWKLFQKMVKQYQFSKDPYVFINPLMGDKRIVVFLNYEVTLNPNPHILDFTFVAKETAMRKEEEILFFGYNKLTNKSQILTDARATEIENNMNAYLLSVGGDIEALKKWSLKGKVVGGGEYQLVLAYIEYKNSGNIQQYNDKKDNLLLKYNLETKLTTNPVILLEETSKADITTEHVVKSGDTLYKIVKKYYNSIDRKYIDIVYNKNKDTLESVAKTNGYKSSEKGRWIFTGTKLLIPKT